MQTQIPSDVPALLASVLLAVVLPGVMGAAFGASGGVVLMGAAAWVGAVAIKSAVALAVGRIVTRPSALLGSLCFAAFHGALSSSAELGLAAIFFARVFSGLPAADIVAFGIGAFSIEVLLSVATAYAAGRMRPRRGTDERKARWIQGARQSVWVRWAALIERVAALLNHVGARALIYHAVIHGWWLPGVAAGLAFSLVDGLAVFGHIRRWNWSDPAIARRYYLFGIAAGALQCMGYAYSLST